MPAGTRRTTIRTYDTVPGGAQASLGTSHLPGTDVTGALGVLTPEVSVPGHATTHDYDRQGRAVRELIALFDPNAQVLRSHRAWHTTPTRCPTRTVLSKAHAGSPRVRLLHTPYSHRVLQRGSNSHRKRLLVYSLTARADVSPGTVTTTTLSYYCQTTISCLSLVTEPTTQKY